MTRRPLVAGNWKMHKTTSEAEGYLRDLLPRVAGLDGVDVAVCAPFTALAAALRAAEGSAVEVYAQTMHEAVQGPFTGDVSAPMLTDLGVHGVVLGHSERRQACGESDRTLAQRVRAALDAGLKPMLCVGESEEERERGETERKLRHQVQEGLQGVAPERLHEVAIAYEPIWAIGTGVVATPEQAEDAVAFVRALVADRSAEAGERVRVLYGGSVTPDNAEELLALPDVDGALVGGASLDAERFSAIVAAAVRS